MHQARPGTQDLPYPQCYSSGPFEYLTNIEASQRASPTPRMIENYLSACVPKLEPCAEPAASAF